MLLRCEIHSAVALTMLLSQHILITLPFLLTFFPIVIGSICIYVFEYALLTHFLVHIFNEASLFSSVVPSVIDGKI